MALRLYTEIQKFVMYLKRGKIALYIIIKNIYIYNRSSKRLLN